jgi:hypothetical protein
MLQTGHARGELPNGELAAGSSCAAARREQRAGRIRSKTVIRRRTAEWITLSAFALRATADKTLIRPTLAFEANAQALGIYPALA